jgi:hypothetical protein
MKSIDIDIATHDAYDDFKICKIASLSCCEPASTNPKREVSFAAHSKVHSVLSRDDYTWTERSACWYTRRDLQQSSTHRSKMVARLENGKPCKNKKEMTYRGLETWTRSGADQVRLKYLEVVDIVLSEQFRQRQLKLHDPERLASQCLASTIWSTLSAIEMGKADEKEAREILSKEDVMAWANGTKGKPMLPTSGRTSRWPFKVLQRNSWG